MARACRDYGRDPRSVAANVDPDGAENDALRAAVATARDAARARSTRRAAYEAFAPYLYEEARPSSATRPTRRPCSPRPRTTRDTLDLEPKKDGDVRLFLNRLQATPVADQKLLFQYFSVAHAAVVKAAKAAGSYDAGLASVRASSVVVNAVTTVDVDAVSGASTKLYELTLDRGASFDAAQDQLRAGRANARPRATTTLRDAAVVSGRGLLHLEPHQHADEAALHHDGGPQGERGQTFLITRPNTGANATELFAHDIISKYTCHAGGLPSASDEEREQLRKAWTLEYESSHNQDNGGRLKRLGLVAGNVLPLWPALAQTVAERAVEMTKEDQRLRAVRVVLPSETIVGVRFPTHVLNTLRAALAQRSRQRAAPRAPARARRAADARRRGEAPRRRRRRPRRSSPSSRRRATTLARLGRRSRRSRRRRRRSGRRPRSAAPLPPSARRRRPAATSEASSRPRPRRSPRRKSRRPRTSSSTSTRSPGPAPSAPTPTPRPRRASSSARRAARRRQGITARAGAVISLVCEIFPEYKIQGRYFNN